MKKIFWKDFLGGFFGRIFGGDFLGGFFWEDFFGRNTLEDFRLMEMEGRRILDP